jgi:hypothetical protein
MDAIRRGMARPDFVWAGTLMISGSKGLMGLIRARWDNTSKESK